MQIRHTLKRNGLIVNLIIHDPLKETRVDLKVHKPGYPEFMVNAKVVLRGGEYLPRIEIQEGSYEGNQSFYIARAIAEAYEQAKWLADDLNGFEVNFNAYIGQLQEYIAERSVEGLALYLPLVPMYLSGDKSQEALALIHRSGLLGDLTDPSDIGRLGENTIKGLVVLAESQPGVTVPDEMPFTGLAEIIKEAALSAPA